MEEDREALGYLRMSCEVAVKQHVAAAAITAAATQLLRQQFRAASKNRLAMLEREKSQLRKLDDESISQYFQRARTLRRDIVAAGGRCDEADLRIPIRNGLHSTWRLPHDCGDRRGYGGSVTGST